MRFDQFDPVRSSESNRSSVRRAFPRHPIPISYLNLLLAHDRPINLQFFSLDVLPIYVGS